MMANSIKAIEVIAESCCKQLVCPCKAKELPILMLPPPDMAKLTKKQRKQAQRTLEFEERLATIAKVARHVNGERKKNVPALLTHVREDQVYIEFDAPISEHMMV